MDCQTCNDLLLDLAYDALDEVRAAAVRKHIDGCDECRAAFARLSRGRALARRLPRDEAPAVSSVLRSAIEAQAARFAEATAGAPTGAAPDSIESPPRSNVIGPGGRDKRFSRWFERVGELAMRRQVAMAAVFLLMIGVGLLFYQSHPRPTDAQDDRVPDVVPAAEVTGSPANNQSANGAPRPLPPGTAPTRGVERDDNRSRGYAQPQAAPVANARSVGGSLERAQQAQAEAQAGAQARAVAPPAQAGASRPSSDDSIELTPPQLALGSQAMGSNSDMVQSAGRGRSSAAQAETPVPTAMPAAPARVAQNVAPAPPTNHVAAPVVAPAAAPPPSSGNVETIATLQSELASAPDEPTRARLRQRLIAAYERQGMIAEASTLRAQAAEPTAAMSNVMNNAGTTAGMAELQQAAPMPTASATSTPSTASSMQSVTNRVRAGRRTTVRRPAAGRQMNDAFESTAGY